VKLVMWVTSSDQLVELVSSLQYQ